MCYVSPVIKGSCTLTHYSIRTVTKVGSGEEHRRVSIGHEDLKRDEGIRNDGSGHGLFHT